MNNGIASHISSLSNARSFGLSHNPKNRPKHASALEAISESKPVGRADGNHHRSKAATAHGSREHGAHKKRGFAQFLTQSTSLFSAKTFSVLLRASEETARIQNSSEGAQPGKASNGQNPEPLASTAGETRRDARSVVGVESIKLKFGRAIDRFRRANEAYFHGSPFNEKIDPKPATETPRIDIPPVEVKAPDNGLHVGQASFIWPELTDRDVLGLQLVKQLERVSAERIASLSLLKARGLHEAHTQPGLQKTPTPQGVAAGHDKKGDLQEVEATLRNRAGSEYRSSGSVDTKA